MTENITVRNRLIAQRTVTSPRMGTSAVQPSRECPGCVSTTTGNGPADRAWSSRLLGSLGPRRDRSR